MARRCLASGEPDASTKLANLLAFNSTKAPPNPNAAVRDRVDCPVVQIQPGHSAVRVGGEGATGVRYQISIGDVARDCERQGNQVVVRVGVETRTVLGTAGSPGTYTAPLRVSLRKISGEQTLSSKTYRVGGAVGSAGNAINTLIAEPMAAPCWRWAKAAARIASRAGDAAEFQAAVVSAAAGAVNSSSIARERLLRPTSAMPSPS